MHTNRFTFLPFLLLGVVSLSGQIATPGGGGLPRLNSNRSEPRPTFLTGQVFLEDGSGISAPIAIIGGCRGNMQMLGYTDMQGHFAIDASKGRSADDAAASGSRSTSICEVSARLDGYRSSTVDLTSHGALDQPEIGTLLLHRIGEQEGSIVSVTSLQAPKSARRAFEKGMAEFRKDHFDAAAKEFEKAVGIYPKYADAWYRLGHLQVEKKDVEAGRASFTKAIAADPRLVPPYVELAGLNVSQGKWQEALNNTQRAIKLDSFGAPAVYFFDSLANYTLKNWDAAEKSARRLQTLDPQHKYIKINRILASILSARKNYPEAIEQMRDYLKYAGDAKDAGEVRQQLADLEKWIAASAVTEPRP